MSAVTAYRLLAAQVVNCDTNGIADVAIAIANTSRRRSATTARSGPAASRSASRRGHNFIGHPYSGNNYGGNNYIGHNYKGIVVLQQRRGVGLRLRTRHLGGAARHGRTRRRHRGDRYISGWL